METNMEPMNRDGLLALYTYNAYANCIVLDGIGELSADEFTRESSPSHGSIRGLLLHLLECEAWFLAICRERTFEEPDLPTLADIRRYQSDLLREQLEFIGSLTETDLARELTIELRGHPYHFLMWQLLVQAFVHSTHHRGELAILLGQMGHPLPTLDIIIHFAKESGQEWPWK
jgi:uncharacterized damage-inducible protein DinB